MGTDWLKTNLVGSQDDTAENLASVSGSSTDLLESGTCVAFFRQTDMVAPTGTANRCKQRGIKVITDGYPAKGSKSDQDPTIHDDINVT